MLDKKESTTPSSPSTKQRHGPGVGWDWDDETSDLSALNSTYAAGWELERAGWITSENKNNWNVPVFHTKSEQGSRNSASILLYYRSASSPFGQMAAVKYCLKKSTS